jgi:hypothetical protein
MEEPNHTAVPGPNRLVSKLNPWFASRRFWAGSVAVVAAILFLGFLLSFFWKRPLSPRGGVYFPFRYELPVPILRQADSRWHDDLLGATPGTLGAEGCAVTSVAMVLNYYGIQTDPQQLNWFLSATGGYTPQGWLYWERAADWSPDRVRHVYEDMPSYFLIDRNLVQRNPVIVRLRLEGGTTHFVVIAGKSGWDYLICDPGSGASKGRYPLKELGSKIEALRYYQKMPDREARK